MHEPERVSVQTGGRTFRGRYAVIALPPALAGRIEYDPLLPVARDQLTQRFPMGATVKCLALYDNAFWRDCGLSGEVVCPSGPVSVVFDNGSHDGRQPALLAFIVGQSAREWNTRMPAERRDAVLDVFARAFGDQARRPMHYVEQDWSTEEWTRGCPVGIVGPGALSACGIGALRAPVGRIHWAGTETATVWAGYMEGAIESATRVAKELAVRL